MLKKIKWIVLMCIFVLTLEGCGNKKIADTETNKIKTSEEDVDEPNKEDDTEQENSGTSDDTTEQENESTNTQVEQQNKGNKPEENDWKYFVGGGVGVALTVFLGSVIKHIRNVS